MENLAHAFDQPIDSREHQVLASTAWIGGELASVRYYLGRLLGRNLFRESNDAVKETLQSYFAANGFEHGSHLVSDYQTWRPLVVVLRHRVELSDGREPTQNPRLVSAIQAFMTNPEITDTELAAIVNTTEKQIARMLDVVVLRKSWQQREGQTA